LIALIAGDRVLDAQAALEASDPQPRPLDIELATFGERASRERLGRRFAEAMAVLLRKSSEMIEP
jgi:hypothetical protein